MNPILEINEHSSASYSPRTYHNAKTADLTVAIASDFTTAGEKLTHKAAGERYLSLDINISQIENARKLYSAMKRFNVKTLNIAGNGIYTLNKSGWVQHNVNMYVYGMLAPIKPYFPNTKIISGGQTGVDLAGLTAGHALYFDVVSTLPKGFIQRGTDMKDKTHTQDEIKNQIIIGAKAIHSTLANN